MRFGRLCHDIASHRAFTAGALVPFLVGLFLCVEPAISQGEDYLPSAPSRSVSIKIVKSLKYAHGGKASTLNRDLTVRGYSLSVSSSQGFVLVGLWLHRLRFGFLSNRLVRSPPDHLV